MAFGSSASEPQGLLETSHAHDRHYYHTTKMEIHYKVVSGSSALETSEHLVTLQPQEPMKTREMAQCHYNAAGKSLQSASGSSWPEAPALSGNVRIARKRP